jgi:hypothetical protein
LWSTNNCSDAAKCALEGLSAPPFRYGVWEAGVRTPRFDGCRHCGERRIASPVSELLPERVSPELRHLQGELAAQLPYRQATALLEELWPETGGLNYATTRNRTLAVGESIDEEIRGERSPRVIPEPVT